LGGIAAGWTAVPRQGWRAAAVLAAVAIVPDLDLLVHDHRGMSHSVGAAVAAGIVAWIVTRSAAAASPRGRDSRPGSDLDFPIENRDLTPERWRWALAVTLAWTSHVALDWLSNDTRPPIGVMALWPFTRQYYKASVEIFPAISRRYWLAEFFVYNAKALLVELVILGPLAWLAIRGRRWISR
jgi:membrane-bound metal-dependent hydrolase YbcI (DUF457 family)